METRGGQENNPATSSIPVSLAKFFLANQSHAEIVTSVLNNEREFFLNLYSSLDSYQDSLVPCHAVPNRYPS